MLSNTEPSAPDPTHSPPLPSAPSPPTSPVLAIQTPNTIDPQSLGNNAPKTTLWDRNLEGFPQDLIVGGQVVDSSFVCTFCDGLVHCGVVTSCCASLYCRGCLAKWLSTGGACPNRCSTPIDPKPVATENKAINRILGRIKVKCPASCDWSGDYSEVEAHLDGDCPNCGFICDKCGENISANERENHPQFCRSRQNLPSLENVAVVSRVLFDAKCKEAEDSQFVLLQALGEISMLKRSIAEKDDELKRTKKLVSELLNFVESVKSGESQANQDGFRCVVCGKLEVAGQPHPECSPYYHPGIYQRIKWKGQEMSCWTCCKSTSPHTRGCEARNMVAIVSQREEILSGVAAVNLNGSGGGAANLSGGGGGNSNSRSTSSGSFGAQSALLMNRPASARQ